MLLRRQSTCSPVRAAAALYRVQWTRSRAPPAMGHRCARHALCSARSRGHRRRRSAPPRDRAGPRDRPAPHPAGAAAPAQRQPRSGLWHTHRRAKVAVAATPPHGTRGSTRPVVVSARGALAFARPARRRPRQTHVLVAAAVLRARPVAGRGERIPQPVHCVRHAPPPDAWCGIGWAATTPSTTAGCRHWRRRLEWGLSGCQGLGGCATRWRLARVPPRRR